MAFALKAKCIWTSIKGKEELIKNLLELFSFIILFISYFFVMNLFEQILALCVFMEISIKQTILRIIIFILFNF